MSLPEWGALLIVLGCFAYVYLVGSARLDEIERRASMDRHPAGNDHELLIFERLPLYDWEVSGDFA